MSEKNVQATNIYDNTTVTWFVVKASFIHPLQLNLTVFRWMWPRSGWVHAAKLLFLDSDFDISWQDGVGVGALLLDAQIVTVTASILVRAGHNTEPTILSLKENNRQE